jgi:hypothetical protein
VLAHHKTVSTPGVWKDQPIEVLRLPARLCTALDEYCAWAHALLTRSAGKAVPQAFFMPKTFQPHNPHTFTAYWRARVLQGTGLNVSPHICRHIFTEEMMERQRRGLPGPLPADAALVMGNSARTLASSYDLRNRARRAQYAVEATSQAFSQLHKERVPTRMAAAQQPPTMWQKMASRMGQQEGAAALAVPSGGAPTPTNGPPTTSARMQTVQPLSVRAYTSAEVSQMAAMAYNIGAHTLTHGGPPAAALSMLPQPHQPVAVPSLPARHSPLPGLPRVSPIAAQPWYQRVAGGGSGGSPNMAAPSWQLPAEPSSEWVSSLALAARGGTT